MEVANIHSRDGAHSRTPGAEEGAFVSRWRKDARAGMRSSKRALKIWDAKWVHFCIGMVFSGALFIAYEGMTSTASESPDPSSYNFAPALSAAHSHRLTKENSAIAYSIANLNRGIGHFMAAGKVPLSIRPKHLRVLVTGGAGFVGSHLVDRLIERGDQVIVIDNFFTGRKENVLHHFGNPRFELIRHDVVEPILLEVDQIYHLACPASPVHYKFNPIKTIKTNVAGTMNMLGLAKRIGARFLLTSTSEVYGDPLEHPQKEEYWGHVNPIGVRSCYDEGKRVAETLTMDYHREAHIEVRIARIFNTYGPRMCIDDGRVVSNFVAQAIRKEPMTVYGDGKQTRSFQYVSDLVAGLMALMDGEHVGPMNIGNPGEFTMLELAEVVKEVVDPEAAVVYKENTQDDPHMRKPDITRAKELLGWEPKIPLREGLKMMVEDFRRRIDGQDDPITTSAAVPHDEGK